MIRWLNHCVLVIMATKVCYAWCCRCSISGDPHMTDESGEEKKQKVGRPKPRTQSGLELNWACPCMIFTTVLTIKKSLSSHRQSDMRAAALNKMLPLRKITEVVKLEPRLHGVSAQCVKTTLLHLAVPGGGSTKVLQDCPSSLNGCLRSIKNPPDTFTDCQSLS